MCKNEQNNDSLKWVADATTNEKLQINLNHNH